MANKNHHKRRKRRTAKQVLRHGPKAKRSHTQPHGRTGSVHSKKLLSRQQPK